MLVLYFVVLLITLYRTNQNCSVYGILNSGVVAWTVDFNGDRIPNSTINTTDGFATIGEFGVIFANSQAMEITFIPKQIDCNETNIINQTNTTYGLLTNGVIAWGLDSHFRGVPLSTTISRNGLSTITVFGNIFRKFNKTKFIGFSPFVRH